jgi:dTDP-4-amino-4,6-dideoxygalactose transaminase
VERAITPRTTGIIGVHLWGRPCPVDELEPVAQRHGLALLYDAAHAFGVSSRGRSLGRFGHAQALSFHATKVLNTAEGGAVVTDDDALAEKMRLMQNFGFAGLDNVVYVGTNGKMNELSAALGLTGLEEFATVVAHNRANHARYRAALDEVPGLHVVPYDAADDPNYQYVVVDVDPAAAGLARDDLVATLRQENVMARRYFFPGCHRMEPYRSDPRYADVRLPVTERTASRVMVLPTGTAVSAGDVDRIVDVVQRILARAHEVRAWITAHGVPEVKGRTA